MPIDEGYLFTPDRYDELLKRQFFPEKTGPESRNYREYLSRHIRDFDYVRLQVRVGEGVTPDPALLDGVQRQAIRNSKKIIDILGMKGDQATIVEVKIRVTIQALGQVLGYRHLYQEAKPDAPEPFVLIVGTYADADALRVITSNGVPVLLYPEAA
jgi:hypothetical protein